MAAIVGSTGTSESTGGYIRSRDHNRGGGGGGGRCNNVPMGLWVTHFNGLAWRPVFVIL